MAFKRCNENGFCPKSPRCSHVWYIKAQHKGDREVGPVTNYPHLLLPGQTRFPDNKTQADEMEARLATWLISGRPLPEPATPQITGNLLIDKWLDGRATTAMASGKLASGLKKSMLKLAREHFGHLSGPDLENPVTYRDFTMAYLARGRKICTPNRIIATVMRPAIRWGMAQRPALIKHYPFGLYQHKVDTRAEGRREQRCLPNFEAELLDACDILDASEFKYAGAYLKDFIVLAIDLGARSGEILALQNKHVNWATHSLIFPKTKRAERRIVPFNPKGRVAAILERRKFAGADAYVIAKGVKSLKRPDPKGKRVGDLKRIWLHAVCLASGIPFHQAGRGTRPAADTLAAYRDVNLHIHDLRHEALTWWGECGLPDRVGEWLSGHQSQSTHGRYRHEDEHKARQLLAERVWPKEHLRGVSARKNASHAD